MTSRKQTPAYFRIIKARLRLVARPEFWGAATSLLVLALFAWQYFTHPDWLNTAWDDSETGNEQAINSNNSSADTTLSQEDVRSIGADIDSLPVIMAEVTPLNVPPSAIAPNATAKSSKQEGLFEAYNRQKASSNTDSTTNIPSSAPVTLVPKPSNKQNTNNTFAASAQEILNNGPFGSGDRFMPIQPVTPEFSASKADGTKTPVQTDNWLNLVNQQDTPTVVPAERRDATNPRSLEAALNQPTQPPTPIPNAQTSLTPLEPREANNQITTTTQGQPLLPTPSLSNAIAPPATTVAPTIQSYSVPPTPTINNPTNSYTYLTQPQSVPVQPTVPATLPSAPVIPGNYYMPQYSTGLPSQNTGVTNPGFNSTLNNSAVQPSQINPPNSIQTRPTSGQYVPGQYIGGGQINTFSNP